MDQFYAFISV